MNIRDIVEQATEPARIIWESHRLSYDNDEVLHERNLANAFDNTANDLADKLSFMQPEIDKCRAWVDEEPTDVRFEVGLSKLSELEVAGNIADTIFGSEQISE
jgi:hypothetical protein